MRRAGLALVLAAACDAGRTDPTGAPDPGPAAAIAPLTPTPASAPPPAITRADEALEVMRTRCGSCHLPDVSEQPRALTIFDLSRDDWSADLTDDQLVDIEHRLVDGGAPFEEVDAVRTYLGAARERSSSPTDC